MRVQLRSKSLLGENYLELTPGEKDSGFIPDGGQLPEAGIEPSVELDEILRSFDKRTRDSFRTWQQQLAIAGAGRGREIGEAFSQFAPLEQEAAKLSKILNRDSESFSKLIRNTGVTFAALSERQEALRGLVRNTERGLLDDRGARRAARRRRSSRCRPSSASRARRCGARRRSPRTRSRCSTS